MAEVVERNLEGSVDELLYIRKAKLFNKQEINELISKRRRLEYALQKRNKRVLDYDAYIATELVVLKLLRLRRQKADDRRFLDKIERSIISRLTRLHRQLCYRFQSRIDVWIRFIHFCKILGRHVSVVRLWNRVLQVHGRTDPRLWIAAASYQLHSTAKTKARCELRQLASETEQLAEQKRKLKDELKILTRFVDKRNQKRIQDVLEELRQSTAQLSEATSELERSRRLVWDQSYLTAIREARRLLTEGLNLNPDCKILYLELVKLEASAADFFNTHIIPRLPLGATDGTGVKSEFRGKKMKKRYELLCKKAAEDNAIFMTQVIEDVPYVASGQALKLAMETVMERWPKDLEAIEALHQVASTIPRAVPASMFAEISASLEKLRSRPTNDVPEIETQTPVSQEKVSRSLLEERTAQLYNTVLTDGLTSALELWNSWYSKDAQDLIRGDTFRFVHPTMPEAVGLLRTRLALHSLQLRWSFLDKSGNSISTQNAAEIRLKNTQLVKDTRLWLDALATSPWGHLSPEFWLLYIRFERDAGDCTRVPAVQWRASKTLSPNAYARFTVLLNGETI
ncbi:unnamed protein product [Dicrocoelium dendriticum]|nr:unnamed protein product [Dicrocoelium dendriticum]CAH8546925.1 unnamed protein product [Dicrocoelium dendriticum]